MKALFDFFPILLFFIVYKFYGDISPQSIDSLNGMFPFMQMVAGETSHAIYLATLVAILATLVQVAITAARTRKVEKMHVITLALLIVFGGATLLLKDPLFIKWKPTAINWLFALVFLGSQFIGEKPLVQRMMGGQIDIPDDQVWLRLNMAWTGFFIFSGLLNIFVAYNFSEDTWVNFKLFGLMGLTFAFVIAQAVYLSRFMQDPESKPE